MRLILSSRASRDLHEIGDWIARDNPDAAERFLAEIEGKAREITTMPLAFTVVPRLSSRGVRKRSVHDYLILYRSDRGTVRIVRIVHGRRDYLALFSQ